MKLLVRYQLLAAFISLAIISLVVIPGGAGAVGLQLIETPFYQGKVLEGRLPQVERRVPEEPLVVNLTDQGLEPGVHGGRIRTLIAKAKSIRYMTVWGYARLIGFDRGLELQPDLLRDYTVEEGRIFTLHLRRGHRWSDGHPFTAEDFRYYWEDIANNEELSPSGPPVSLTIDGEPPVFEVIDDQTVRFTWSKPNPRFLGLLAQARPPFIYRPAHYLKQFHRDYAEPYALEEKVLEANVRSWAALHNRVDNMYKNDNPDLPTLQPWVNSTAPPASRFTMIRNPYYHRVDQKGRQLPYVDEVVMSVASSGLIPAKTVSGDSDLQARGLVFANATVLRNGEERGGYRMHLWPIAKASYFALYPNLNYQDDAWRTLLRDRDFRCALSIAIDRHGINQTLFFGLGAERGNAVLPESPLYREENASSWTKYDVDKANEMLDELGLIGRDEDGYRTLPDGRTMQIIVETAGESSEETDILQLIEDNWRRIGIKLFSKPSQRDVLRTRAYAGQTMMTVWSGWDNGTPSPTMSPDELAPVHQDNLGWPKWGQYFETKGKSGEPPDIPAAKDLLALYKDWMASMDPEEQERIWLDMLRIHAEEQFIIGVLSSVHQPVVVSKRLRNVPEHGFYGWDPGAQFGIFRPDQFWFRPEG